jgi:DNA polymerase III subunit delta'
MFAPNLFGHQSIRQRLLDRLQARRLTGSLLFVGPQGIGKRRVAMELAQRELCFKKSACGACEACKVFQSDPLPLELPNFLRVAPEGKAGVIKIGAIREDDLVEGGVIQWASLSPPPSCHRWILIEDAHRLNGASANMLLKTLEEPPPGTHFLLVTHRPEAVLQTIRSRCERIPFNRLGDDESWAVAKAQGWGEVDRERWTALSEGSLRFLDEGNFARAVEQVEAWIQLASGASFQSAAEALLPEKDAEVAQSEQLRQPLELLLCLLADVAKLRVNAQPRLHPWQAELARLAASSLDLKAPQEIVYDALKNLARNLSAEPLLKEVALSLRNAESLEKLQRII